MKKIHHFVNGKAFEGNSKKTSDVYDPSIGEVSAKVPLATKQDVDKVVDIAHSAFHSWSSTPALQRARILFKFKELIRRTKLQIKD